MPASLLFVSRDFHAAKFAYQLSVELQKDFPHHSEFLIEVGAEAFLKDKINQYFVIDNKKDELVAKNFGQRCQVADYFNLNDIDCLIVAVSKGSNLCEQEIIEFATKQNLPIFVLFCDAIRPQFLLSAENQKMLAINEKTLNFLDSEYPDFQKFGIWLSTKNEIGEKNESRKRRNALISKKERFVIYYFLQSDRIPDHDNIFLAFIGQLQRFHEFFDKFELFVRAHPAEPQSLERLRPHCLKLPFNVRFEIGGALLDEAFEIANLLVSINSLCLEDYLFYCDQKRYPKIKPLYLMLTAGVREHLDEQNGTWRNEYMSNGLAGLALSNEQIFFFLGSCFSGKENLPHKIDVGWSMRQKNAKPVSWLARQLKAQEEVSK